MNFEEKKKIEKSEVERLQERITHWHRKYNRTLLKVGGRIHDTLEDKGWSDRDLADKMGVSEKEVEIWMAGTRNLDMKTLAKLEEVLDVELIEFKSEPTKPSNKEQ